MTTTLSHSIHSFQSFSAGSMAKFLKTITILEDFDHDLSTDMLPYILNANPIVPMVTTENSITEFIKSLVPFSSSTYNIWLESYIYTEIESFNNSIPEDNKSSICGFFEICDLSHFLYSIQFPEKKFRNCFNQITNNRTIFGINSYSLLKLLSSLEIPTKSLFSNLLNPSTNNNSITKLQETTNNLFTTIFSNFSPTDIPDSYFIPPTLLIFLDNIISPSIILSTIILKMQAILHKLEINSLIVHPLDDPDSVNMIFSFSYNLVEFLSSITIISSIQSLSTTSNSLIIINSEAINLLISHIITLSNHQNFINADYLFPHNSLLRLPSSHLLKFLLMLQLPSRHQQLLNTKLSISSYSTIMCSEYEFADYQEISDIILASPPSHMSLIVMLNYQSEEIYIPISTSLSFSSNPSSPYFLHPPTSKQISHPHDYHHRLYQPLITSFFKTFLLKSSSIISPIPSIVSTPTPLPPQSYNIAVGSLSSLLKSICFPEKSTNEIISRIISTIDIIPMNISHYAIETFLKSIQVCPHANYSLWSQCNVYKIIKDPSNNNIANSTNGFLELINLSNFLYHLQFPQNEYSKLIYKLNRDSSSCFNTFLFPVFRHYRCSNSTIIFINSYYLQNFLLSFAIPTNMLFSNQLSPSSNTIPGSFIYSSDLQEFLKHVRFTSLILAAVILKLQLLLDKLHLHCICHDLPDHNLRVFFQTSVAVALFSCDRNDCYDLDKNISSTFTDPDAVNNLIQCMICEPQSEGFSEESYYDQSPILLPSSDLLEFLLQLRFPTPLITLISSVPSFDPIPNLCESAYESSVPFINNMSLICLISSDTALPTKSRQQHADNYQPIPLNLTSNYHRLLLTAKPNISFPIRSACPSRTIQLSIVSFFKHEPCYTDVSSFSPPTDPSIDDIAWPSSLRKFVTRSFASCFDPYRKIAVTQALQDFISQIAAEGRLAVHAWELEPIPLTFEDLPSAPVSHRFSLLSPHPTNSNATIYNGHPTLYNNHVPSSEPIQLTLLNTDALDVYNHLVSINTYSPELPQDSSCQQPTPTCKDILSFPYLPNITTPPSLPPVLPTESPPSLASISPAISPSSPKSTTPTLPPSFLLPTQPSSLEVLAFLKPHIARGTTFSTNVESSVKIRYIREWYPTPTTPIHRHPNKLSTPTNTNYIPTPMPSIPTISPTSRTTQTTAFPSNFLINPILLPYFENVLSQTPTKSPSTPRAFAATPPSAIASPFTPTASFNSNPASNPYNSSTDPHQSLSSITSFYTPTLNQPSPQSPASTSLMLSNGCYKNFKHITNTEIRDISHWYTDSEIRDILKLSYGKTVYIASALPMHSPEVSYLILQDSINEALNGSQVLMPVNLYGIHWAGLSILKISSCDLIILFNDPLGASIDISLTTMIHRIDKTIVIYDFQVVQQYDDSSCGPITVTNLAIFAELGSTCDIAQIRSKLATTYDIENLRTSHYGLLLPPPTSPPLSSPQSSNVPCCRGVTKTGLMCKTRIGLNTAFLCRHHRLPKTNTCLGYKPNGSKCLAIALNGQKYCRDSHNAASLNPSLPTLPMISSDLSFNDANAYTFPTFSTTKFNEKERSIQPIFCEPNRYDTRSIWLIKSKPPQPYLKKYKKVRKPSQPISPKTSGTISHHQKRHQPKKKQQFNSYSTNTSEDLIHSYPSHYPISLSYSPTTPTILKSNRMSHHLPAKYIPIKPSAGSRTKEMRRRRYKNKKYREARSKMIKANDKAASNICTVCPIYYNKLLMILHSPHVKHGVDLRHPDKDR